MADVRTKCFHQERFFDARGNPSGPTLQDIESPEGNTSALEIVRHIFKRAGLGGAAYEPLYEPFAEVFMQVYGNLRKDVSSTEATTSSSEGENPKAETSSGGQSLDDLLKQ